MDKGDHGANKKDGEEGGGNEESAEELRAKLENSKRR